MTAVARPYNPAADFERVGDFLLQSYRRTGAHVNWLQPRWEYMHYHPLIWEVDLTRNGVWESDGEIAGVVHLEHFAGNAYFELHPAYPDLREEMVTWAEDWLSEPFEGRRRLTLYILDGDEAFEHLAVRRGYARTSESDPMSRLAIPSPFPPIALPAGFALRSLADDNDLVRVDRALWKGFNHGDTPPNDGLAGRRFMQSAPRYRKDLNIVAVAPDGEFVAYCGMWLQQPHAIAYVEPVATVPAYRRMGLGAAVVLEGIRRCGQAGAAEAWVGSTQPFYLSLGFREAYRSAVWRKVW